ncbi:MAG TPA: ABC transporter ATP-binding protein [Acidimicrobiales bacterium]
MTPLTGELAPESLNGKGVSGKTGHPSHVTGGHVHLDGVTKRYGRGAGSVLALDGIHLDVQPGEFVCLVGASGCGKSTLLNLVADLDQPTSGTVEVSGKTGVMFQEAALFPWLTVAGNIELAQQLHGVKKAERQRRSNELLEVVHLEGFAKKRPHELSGGMRQRVALARTLAQDADVLLMDEPFGALDAITRDFLHDELERLYLERGFTVLFVTHNVREAVRLGTRIVLLTSRPGRVAEEFVVEAERPRRMDDPTTSALSVRITERLREEVRRHADD